MSEKSQDTLKGPWLASVSTACIRDPELSPGAFRAYANLCGYMNDDRIAWPGYERQGKDLGVKPRTAMRYIEELLDRGWLTVKSRFRKDEGQTSNEYEIHITRQDTQASERDKRRKLSLGDDKKDTGGVTENNTPGSDTDDTQTSPSEPSHAISPSIEECAPDGAPPQTPAQNDVSPEQDEPTLDETEALLEHDLVKLRRFREEQDAEGFLAQGNDFPEPDRADFEYDWPEVEDDGINHEATETDDGMHTDHSPQSQDSGEQNGNSSAAPRKRREYDCIVCPPKAKCPTCDSTGKTYRSPKQQEQDTMSGLWGYLCGGAKTPEQFELLGDNDKGNCRSVAKEWRGAGYTVQQMRDFIEWFRENHSYNQKPKITTAKSWFLTWLNSNGHRPQIPAGMTEEDYYALTG
jgi:hypothetical protein